LLYQHQSVVAERGEGGESPTQAGDQQQPHFGGEIEAGGQGVEQPDEETPEKVDGERGPWERVGEDALMEHLLHAVAEHAAGASAKEDGYQFFDHC